MSVEKFIRGKRDSARHVGLHSIRMALDESVNKMREHLQGEPMVGGFHPEQASPYLPEGEGTEIVLFPQVDARDIRKA